MADLADLESGTPLWRLAALIRSKNAGPFVVTVDVMFDRWDTYERVRTSGVLTRQSIAELYGLDPVDVSLTEDDASLAIKASFPRRAVSGSVGDTDVFGGQFHGPLVDMRLP